jgi:hypothetical protein
MPGTSPDGLPREPDSLTACFAALTSHAFEVCRRPFKNRRQRLDVHRNAPLRRLRTRVDVDGHEAGGLPPGARLLVLGRQNVSEGGRLSWCTLGWT